MRISTKTHLGLLFLVTMRLIGIGSTLIANSIVTNHIIREAQERVREDLNTARSSECFVLGS